MARTRDRNRRRQCRSCDARSGDDVSGQGGISSRGDRGAYFISGAAGTDFADGRGNIAVAGEYSRNNALYNTDRGAGSAIYDNIGRYFYAGFKLKFK